MRNVLFSQHDPAAKDDAAPQILWWLAGALLFDAIAGAALLWATLASHVR